MRNRMYCIRIGETGLLEASKMSSGESFCIIENMFCEIVFS